MRQGGGHLLVRLVPFPVDGEYSCDMEGVLGIGMFFFSWVTFNRHLLLDRSPWDFWSSESTVSLKNTWGRDCSGSYFAGMTASIEGKTTFSWLS